MSTRTQSLTHLNPLLESTLNHFNDIYGSRSSPKDLHIARAPGRVNLIGNGIHQTQTYNICIILVKATVS
jgi:galactokinase